MTEDTQPKLKIRQIEIRTHAHASEDLEKIYNLFFYLLPFEITRKEIETDNLSGIFGQKIINFKITLSKQSKIKNFIQFLGKKMNVEDKAHLTQNFERRFDKKNKFYFRLDKQAAALEKVALASNKDVIQVIISNLNKTPMITTTPTHILKFYQSLNFI